MSASSSPPSTSRPFKTVDVFTTIPFQGNPVAVILDAEGLSTEQMQNIARWTNLSETTFVLPPRAPEADYRLRIFTPGGELPFAGHPTLGSAFALWEAGQVTPREGRLVQECAAGLIPLVMEESTRGTRLTLTMPPATFVPLPPEEVTELEALLGHTLLRQPAPTIVDVGAVWIVAQVESAQALLDLQPDYARMTALEHRLNGTGVTLFAPQTVQLAHSPHDIEVRSFAPSSGIAEDPVCGSGNGAVAYFRHASGELGGRDTAYTAQQGRCVRRDGHITLTVTVAGQVTVGGTCVTCVHGQIAT